MFHNDKDPLEIVSDRCGITEASAIIDSISRLYRSRRIIMYADVKECKTISKTIKRAFHPRRSQPLR